ncbi:MAG: ABC transporter permease [Acidimicrobiia bacterium]
MKALAIAGVNIRRMTRDRSSFFFVFVLPLVLVLVLGAVYGGAFRPKLGVVAGGGPLAQSLVTGLEADRSIEVIPYADVDKMVLAVERGELQGGLDLPEDFDQLVQQHVEVGFTARDLQEQIELRTVIDQVVAQQNAVLRAAGFASARGVASYPDAIATAQAEQANVERIDVQTQSVGQPYSFTLGGRFDLGAQSELVLFIFLTSLTGSAALIQSRTYGVSRRMLSTPTRMGTILVGEALGRFGVAMVQGLFIILGTWILFRVDWGDPLATGLLLVSFSLVGAGAAMVMGSLFRNVAQASGIGVLLGLGLAALGGCMVPLQVFEIFAPTMYHVAHITPHAWALEAFSKIVQLHGHVSSIIPDLAVLIGYAIVLLSVATWLLRRTLTRA